MKREAVSFLVGVAVGYEGVKVAVHGVYLSIIVMLVLAQCGVFDL